MTGRSRADLAAAQGSQESLATRHINALVNAGSGQGLRQTGRGHAEEDPGASSNSEIGLNWNSLPWQEHSLLWSDDDWDDTRKCYTKQQLGHSFLVRLTELP